MEASAVIFSVDFTQHIFSDICNSIISLQSQSSGVSVWLTVVQTKLAVILDIIVRYVRVCQNNVSDVRQREKAKRGGWKIAIRINWTICDNPGIIDRVNNLSRAVSIVLKSARKVSKNERTFRALKSPQKNRKCRRMPAKICRNVCGTHESERHERGKRRRNFVSFMWSLLILSQKQIFVSSLLFFRMSHAYLGTRKIKKNLNQIK